MRKNSSHESVDWKPSHAASPIGSSGVPSNAK
jgi:hypothetical protein